LREREGEINEEEDGGRERKRGGVRERVRERER